MLFENLESVKTVQEKKSLKNLVNTSQFSLPKSKYNDQNKLINISICSLLVALKKMEH